MKQLCIHAYGGKNVIWYATMEQMKHGDHSGVKEVTRPQGSTHSVVRGLADTTVAVMLHVFPLWVHQMTKQQAKKN